VWLGSLAARPLYKPDEARYGEIAREMAASGDLVTPRLNGFKYFEKPPLQYWASAAAISIFGPNDWAARLWTGLMALLGVVLTFHAGRKLFTAEAGALSAAVLASSPLYVLLGQVNTLDMGVSVFLSAGVFAFAAAQRAGAPPERRRWMLAAWAACALAVLSKGLIGAVLPAATVVLYVLVARDWNLLRRLELLRGCAVLLAVAAPWFVAVSLRNPEFPYFFFFQEHWLRFASTIHHRSEPAWFFLPVLAVGMAPWLLAVLPAWLRALRRPRGAGFSAGLFLALWAVVVLVFFSASGSKLPPYILPMLPALAVLTGAYLAEAPRSGLLVAQCLLLAAAGIALTADAFQAVLTQWPALQSFAGAFRPWLAGAVLALVAAGALGAVAASAELRDQAVSCVAAGSLAAMLLVLVGHRAFAPAYTVAPLVAAAPAADRARFYAVDAYDHTMPWSLRSPVTMVRYKDELAAPIAWEPKRFLPDAESFRRAWRAERDAYAFLPARDFDRLREELDLPMQEVARGPRYVLVRKP
jgi:4-amino-4-deoxy-L-arabinose transferase-like glycosyltransferase